MPMSEALSTAHALLVTTGDQCWRGRLLAWWQYAQEHLIDTAEGSWRHERSADNRVARQTWVGKPDVDHALQTRLLIGDSRPLAPSFATALALR